MTHTEAQWSRTARKVTRRSNEYWATVHYLGLPSEDWDSATCDGDTGNGPCGGYASWMPGHCANGHRIEFDA